MVDRIRADDTLVEELDQKRQDAERLRWINAHVREANEADLIEDTDVVEVEEDGLPVTSDT